MKLINAGAPVGRGAQPNNHHKLKSSKKPQPSSLNPQDIRYDYCFNYKSWSLIKSILGDKKVKIRS